MRILVRCAVTAASMALLAIGCTSGGAPQALGGDLPPGGIGTIAGGAVIGGAVSPTEVALLGACGLATDPASGALYISDASRHLILRVSPDRKTLEPFAGTQVAGFNGDGRPALETALHVPCQLAVHPTTGDVYFADISNYRIRAVKKDGSEVRTVAGIGVRGVPDDELPTEPPVGPGLAVGGFGGDEDSAEQAELNLAAGLALDHRGNVYLSDSGNHRVRVVNTQSEPIRVAGVTIEPGRITTIAGTGVPGGGGDGGPAREAQLGYPKQLTIDSEGNVFVADVYSKRVRRIDGETGTISTVAHGGAQADGALRMFSVAGLATASDGTLYYSDINKHAIFEYLPETGDRRRIAGTGVVGLSEEGEEARRAAIHGPAGLSVGTRGELYFVDGGNNRVRVVEDGKISTVAGGGSAGDGVPATEAVFSVLGPIATDAEGNVYIGDLNLHQVRRIDAETGIITPFAGNGSSGYAGDGGDPLDAEFVEPTTRVFEGDPALYIADPTAGVVRRVVPTPEGRTVETVAGTGRYGPTEDGEPATEADLALPLGLAKHPETGNLHITSLWQPAIYELTDEGTLRHIAGTGEEGYGGDGGPAVKAQFHWPTAIAFDEEGKLFVTDYFNNRIRVVQPDGTIEAFAGTGERGDGGDGGPAAEAQFNGPNDLAIDSEGNIFVADINNHRVRRIDADPPHRVTTLAGTGARGFSGDGGPAAEAQLNLPRGLALSPDERTLYVTDSLNGRIRAIRLAE